MNTRKWTNSLLAAAMLTGLVAAAIVYRVAFASAHTEDFFSMRNSVYSMLHDRATTPVEGVTIILPPTESELQRIAKPFPDEMRIRSIVREQDWLGGGGFQLLLELDDSALPMEKQGSL